MQFYRFRTRNNIYSDSSLRHEFGQANPLNHARLRLDCDCELTDIPKTLKVDCYFDNAYC